MTTQDTILKNMQNLIRQDDTNFELMFVNFQNNMQNFINNRLGQERETIQRLFERLNQIQQRNPRRITVNHRRTQRFLNGSPRIGRSSINLKRQRLIGSLQRQIENEDNFMNSDIINNFINNIRNNPNTENQLIRYNNFITNIPNEIEDNFMSGLGIHSNVDNIYLGEAIIEPRSGSGSSLTFKKDPILSKRKTRENYNSDSDSDDHTNKIRKNTEIIQENQIIESNSFQTDFISD
ncbi:449_t:CDS:1, partial [Scutellospora calospora]